MQTAQIAALTVVLALGTSVATYTLLGTLAEPPAPPDPNAGEAAQLREDVGKLRQECADLRRQLAARPAAANREMTGLGDARIEEAVMRWLDQNRDKLGLKDMAAAKAAKAAKVDMVQAYQMLVDMNGSWDARNEMWQKVVKAGQLDEMVKRLRGHVKSSPNSADAHVALGNGLVQKIWSGNITGLEQATIGMQIDRSYATALELDPEHWEARYSRAIGMTHWPAYMGGQAQAIKNFETLIEQQERRTAKPEYASTYMLLGNVYAQQGKNDKAKAAWRQGLKLFPDDKELKERLK